MVINFGGKKYEVVGIVFLGLVFIFVCDKSINFIEKVVGKKFVVLGYDDV